MDTSTGSAAASSSPSELVSVDVLEFIADAVICTDEDGCILFFNRAAEQSFGYGAQDVIGRHVEMLLPQQYREQHSGLVRSFATDQGDGTNRIMGSQREVWGRRRNGEEFPSEAIVSRHSLDGRTILTAVHRDITERKEIEKQREAIARELDHRIRNVLAVVSSLVALSARSAENVADFARSLQERLRALAATQPLLRMDRNESICLNELLLTELNLYRSTDGANISIEGESVTLCSTAVQPLALVFHELATNSAKYGSLSVPQGRVSVNSERMKNGEEEQVIIEWREAGGPPVALPSRQGFGSTLIEQMIRRVLKAEFSVAYEPEGLVCRLICPKTQLEGPS